MKITYTFNNENVPSKLNPQQKQLVGALGGLGTVEKDDILLALEGNLTTKQDPWLIFKYYQPGFIKSGFVSLDKQNKEKPEKVKKESKTEVEEIVVKLAGDAFPPEDDENGEETVSMAESEASGF